MGPDQGAERRGPSTPGSGGPGTPSLPRRAVRAALTIARLVRSARWRAARHLLVAEAVNSWHFHLRPARERVRCPCCGWSGPEFLALPSTRAVSFASCCPACGSRSRHRGLHALLAEVVARKPPGPALVFAPEAVLVNRLRALGVAVETTDLGAAGVDHPSQDIRRLTLADGSYAMLVCNHVLEHVDDDRAAVSECARVLRPGGLAVFTVPGRFPSRETIEFAHPDANGHLRDYGMDFVDKLRRSFADVVVRKLADGAPPSWRVHVHDYARSSPGLDDAEAHLRDRGGPSPRVAAPPVPRPRRGAGGARTSRRRAHRSLRPMARAAR